MKADYIFEVSWEVCNKVGGIYTVISSKIPSIAEQYKDNYILVGPDVWKETSENPDFIEDKQLLRSWMDKAAKDGLKLRIGRWRTQCSPIVILVDFTCYFPEKDKIFAKFWETYKLDSLSGQWDYIEPALFGYAAGMVIENFYKYNISAQDKIIAHFHEWLTGTGILYLREFVPQAGCVFTTHATVIGRAIAGNGMPLYEDMSAYNPDVIARQFDIVAKHSLEKIAAEISDCFTTVSAVTARECTHFLGKTPDVITPNGFDIAKTEHEKKKSGRKPSRELLFKVAEAVVNRKLDRNAMLVLNSGRYEFRNKGIDLFIESLARYNQREEYNKSILAFIMIPAYHSGIRKDVKERIGKITENLLLSGSYLTHNLYNPENDAVLSTLKLNKLENMPSDKVQVIFVPAYLNGKDGIFNLEYYDLLQAFDLTVFPSYYEPWGYTPLESLAYKVPTITTSLSGFGQWIRDNSGDTDGGIIVLERQENNETDVVDQLTGALNSYSLMDESQIKLAVQITQKIAREVRWQKMKDYYCKAFAFALEKVNDRFEEFRDKRSYEYLIIQNGKGDKPGWRKLFIRSNIIKELAPLEKLAQNLWWTWNYEAEELFALMDPVLWEESGHNPFLFFDLLSIDQMKSKANDKEYMERLAYVHEKFEKYIQEGKSKAGPLIAYYSMEFGLHHTIKTYSGGLGVLAGDYLKEASDQNINMVGISLLYRYGYFQQAITLFGEQIPKYIAQKFSVLPLKPVFGESGEWEKVSLVFPGRTITAKVWRLDVGRVPLYLLDTDIEENNHEDQSLTNSLYGGDWNHRFRQELLLGVGGIRLLDKIQIKPDLYHCNEGHAAFIGIERLRILQDRGLSFECAREIIRSTTLFTTHTPVPAGHDSFTEDTLRAFIPHYADRFNIDWDTFMGLGRINSKDRDEKFSMSNLAARLSQEINGVSRIHGRVTRSMFSNLYEGYFPEELHIDHVTNGVHFKTWTSANWQKLYSDWFGDSFKSNKFDQEAWNKVFTIPDSLIWETHIKDKRSLIAYIKQKLNDDFTNRQENPKLILQTLEAITEDALIIGFARRFATYKRAHLLFSNIERLNEILNREGKPVILLYAGKAHPNDKPGQDYIKQIVEFSRKPEYAGKIIFLENYDMYVAKKLVSGVDVWLNTPTRPLEASGTSGMKAVMNGVLNFSVLDGWWAEGYREDAGWGIKEARTYTNQALQDILDSETIYNMIEDELVPKYFSKDAEGVSAAWVRMMKNNIAGIAPNYTTTRMMNEYFGKFYNKLYERSVRLKQDNYKLAREIESWKNMVLSHWDEVEAVSVRFPDSSYHPLSTGENFEAEVVLNTASLDAENIGVEIVFIQKESEQVEKLIFTKQLSLFRKNKSLATYKCIIPATNAGVYDYSFRIFPVSPNLPHRQDFLLLKWV